MTEAKDTDGTPLAQLGQRIADAETLRELAPADDIAGDTLCEIADRLERSAGSLPPAPRDGLVGSDEAVETALSAVDWSLIGEPNGTTMASAREAAAHVAGTVAARVRAEAVAEALDLMRAHADDESLNPDALWRQVDRQWSNRMRSERAGFERAVVEAVAEERQQCVDEIRAVAVSKPGLVAGGMEHAAALITLGSTVRDIEAQRGYIAAGSVPVATPTPTARDERPHSRACGWRRHEHGSACAVDCPTCAAGATPAEPELPVNWYHRHGTDEDSGRRFVYCEARGPVRAHCVRPRHGESEGTHQWAWFTVEDRTEAESAATPSAGAGTPAQPPTFEQLLSDPLEQFDRRSELLPAILRHLCSPDVDALLRSIEEYRNAPPAAATTANIHPPRRKLMSLNVEGRHPSTQHFSPLFSFEHLPEGKPRTVSREFRTMAQQMIDGLPDGPELTAGLRKLLEAKDCFVRALMLAAIKQ